MMGKCHLSLEYELWNSCNWIVHLHEETDKNPDSQVCKYTQDTEVLVELVLWLDMQDMVDMLEEVVEVQVALQSLQKIDNNL